MAIYRLLEGAVFGPQEVARLVAAYEEVLRCLELEASRYAAANELIARKVVEVAHSGEDDPSMIAQRVLAELRMGDWVVKGGRQLGEDPHS
jgi:hypothetical protein